MQIPFKQSKSRVPLVFLQDDTPLNTRQSQDPEQKFSYDQISATSAASSWAVRASGKGREGKNLKRIVLTVDSRSRDNLATTTASDYYIHFPAMRQVISANLIGVEIPNSQYVINATNNSIDFNDVGGGTGIHTATVTPGSYSALTLATEIDLEMNAALGLAPGTNFTVTYLTSLQKMRITRILNGNFSLLWFTGPNAATSLAKKLGFTSDKINVASATSDQIINLAGENFVFLTIEKFGSIRSTETIQDIFGKIVWNIPPKFICYQGFVANPILFPEPINNLDRFHVRFRQQDGSLYDFNGIDHSFSVEFYIYG